MKSLQEVLDFLDNIPAINSGGCGVSAYAVYKWLEKNNSLSEDFAIIYLHRWGMGDMRTNKKFLKGKSDRAVACSHVVFRYLGMYYDSEGVYIKHIDQDTSVYIEAKDVDRFMKASLASNDWNRRFQRKQHVPSIEENLGIELGINLEHEPYEG